MAIALVTAGCTTVNTPSTTIPATTTAPTPPVVAPDVIEYRVFGDVGSSTVQIRYTDSINGLTVLPAASLPYVARVTSTAASLFVLLEATAQGPLVYTTPAVLQVQIVINGVMFREGFATGYSVLSATASGTWRR